MTKYRIWIDQDSVLYDLHDPWLKQHNIEYPDHQMKKEDHIHWDASKPCKDNNCNADIYKYFLHPKTWLEGGVIECADFITQEWYEEKIADLGIITTAANAMSIPYKVEWLQHYFPHITDILVSHKAHLKHLLRGDILIDDGPHNLEHWQGIGILFTQPWNQHVNRLRANNWDEVDSLVRRMITFLDAGYEHKWIENVLYSEQRINKK